MTQDAETLARAVAADLAGEFGQDLSASTERAIRGEAAQPTRNWTQEAANVAQIAQFIWMVAPLVIAKVRQLQSRDDAQSAVEGEMARPSWLDPEKYRRIIAALVSKASEKR